MNDPVIPILELACSSSFKIDDDKYSTVAHVLFNGKPILWGRISTKNDIFKIEKKKKIARKGIACVLAYYLALTVTRGKSKEAENMACDWLTKKGDADIRKALRNHKIPKQVVSLVRTEPGGIIFMFEPSKIVVLDDKMSYRGFAWAWSIGDLDALVGILEFKDVEAPIAIESPVKQKNARKHK